MRATRLATRALRRHTRRFSFEPHPVPSWATVDPWLMCEDTPQRGASLVDGRWVGAEKEKAVLDPLNGEAMLFVPDTEGAELEAFVESMRRVPKSGLHNPLKSPECYFEMGEVNGRVGAELRKPDVIAFFAELLQRVVPKHDAQVMGEVTTVRKWIEGFAGDGVRRLAESKMLPGDHMGQETKSYRWPYGGTSVITPFNFPLEIPALQSLASVWMGNKCTVKVDEKVQIVYEQFLRLCLHCGLDPKCIDLFYGSGPAFNEVLVRGDSRMTLFTGSQRVAEKLTIDLRGRVKLEDAGFDWKILGPDVRDFDYVVWQSDQDAYAFSGQKCSAQSVCFVHENWARAGFVEAIAARAGKRQLADLTSGPVLSWSTERMLNHVDAVLGLRGAELAFGGAKLPGSEQFPDCYGGLEPTAVTVPLDTLLGDEAAFRVATTELFGPFQVLVPFADADLPRVLEACERMDNHLTAAVVSNDAHFSAAVLGATVNGTTYSGMRARTTGAPQNHWFGPCGDPRSAGIHTPDAIRLCWSSHREVIVDQQVAAGWEAPSPT